MVLHCNRNPVSVHHLSNVPSHNRIISIIVILKPPSRFKKGVDIRFARKNSPEMFKSSHRTTTIFWPLSNCFATVLANRPRR
jgi:hypothetical protein